MTVKSREDLVKNPYIKFGADCETQAMKLRKTLAETLSQELPVLNTSSIIEKFQVLKRIERSNPPPVENLTRRLKHIKIHNSGMQYNGNRFEKTSRIITCKKPF